ncbi:MAG: hypothetical protein WCJ35_07540 [Planctomycetota bacterium]
MASVSRTALFGKIHKVLKKYHKPVSPPAERTVLEHLLFACVLEDARYEPAEEAFAALRHTFYDWNEVRVTSISELSEIMSAVPDPRAAANRIKRVLHSLFEELYSFDLEDKRKNNLGPTVKWLEKMDGTTKFVVAYVVQSALGGHSIPVDAGTLAALRVLDLLTDKELAAGEVPGMERAVSKSKGVEFGSLVHQLGADYLANPFSPQVREILLAIDPEASGRFPQRRPPRSEPSPAAEVASPPPVTTGRKKKTKAAVIEPAVADSNTDETKPAEAKKVVGSASTKAAESASKSSASEKQHDKPPKAEKTEKVEKHSHHAEKPEITEKHEKLSPEASNTLSASDGLGKRKPR